METSHQDNYEAIRLANIRRNEEFLKLLGFGGAQQTLPSEPILKLEKKRPRSKTSSSNKATSSELVHI